MSPANGGHAPGQALPQVLGSQDCLPCQVCCRFPDADTGYRPYFLAAEVEGLIAGSGATADWFGQAAGEEHHGGQVEVVADTAASGAQGAGWHCPFLEEETHACRIYDRRPLDCQLYPLMLTLTADGAAAGLHLDGFCPAHERYLEAAGVVERVAALVEERAGELAADPNLIADRVHAPRLVRVLPRLSAALGLGGQYRLRRLRLEERAVVERYNAAERAGALANPAAAEPACYARGFVSLYLIRQRHSVLLAEGERHLVAIVHGGGSPWFPVAPLGPALDADAVAHALAVFQSLGGGGTVHLPAVRECDRVALEAAGFTLRREGVRVVALRDEVAALSGHRMRAHRNLVHRAESAGVELRSATPADTGEILRLWDRWWQGSQARGQETGGGHAPLLASESRACLLRALHERQALGVVDLVALHRGELCGYTAGAALDGDTFTVHFELADREPPGIAQLLARELAVAAAGHVHLDLMDDCGLPRVAWAKSRYGRELPVFGALRRTAAPAAGE